MDHNDDVLYQWKLLHRGSQHGGSRNLMLQKCKDKQLKNLIIIIETTSGNIFGGCPNKFIFTFFQNHTYKVLNGFNIYGLKDTGNGNNILSFGKSGGAIV